MFSVVQRRDEFIEISPSSRALSNSHCLLHSVCVVFQLVKCLQKLNLLAWQLQKTKSSILPILGSSNQPFHAKCDSGIGIV